MSPISVKTPISVVATIQMAAFSVLQCDPRPPGRGSKAAHCCKYVYTNPAPRRRDGAWPDEESAALAGKRPTRTRSDSGCVQARPGPGRGGGAPPPGQCRAAESAPGIGLRHPRAAAARPAEGCPPGPCGASDKPSESLNLKNQCKQNVSNFFVRLLQGSSHQIICINGFWTPFCLPIFEKRILGLMEF